MNYTANEIGQSNTPEQPADAWGREIAAERKAELDNLFALQQAWAEHPPEMRQGENVFKELRFTGADVFWLAQRALVGLDATPVALAETTDRLVRLERLDLSTLHLENAYLGGAHLERAALRGAHLEGANLSDTHLEGANLSDTHLEGADLSNAHLEGADLSDARLEGARLSDTHLERASLYVAHLEDSILGRAHLERADLGGAYLERAGLYAAHLEDATLTEAHLEHAYLGWAHLEDARLGGAHLEDARLGGAYLKRTDLGGAYLEGATLTEAHLEDATMRAANLEGADLRGAHLEGADLRGAHLEGADLRGAHLDEDTNIEDARLGPGSLRNWLDQLRWRNRNASLGDIKWHNADLTATPWERVRRLGDERAAALLDGADEHRAVVRAYRQVAQRLRDQGMADDADRFSYRAQIRQRGVLLRTFRLPQYLFSWLLAIIAGYGYRPERTLFWYVVTITGFMWGYLRVTHGAPLFGLTEPAGTHPLHWYEALVLSLASFHGRGFFPQNINLGDPVAILAASEAVIGLFVEISFIATFTQRYFGGK